jgi:hypothetical protein
MDWIRGLLEQFGTNQFLSGGFLLMALGASVVAAKQWGAVAFRWIGRQCIVTVEIRNNDRAFDWIAVWLDKHPYSKRSRKLSVSTMKSPSKESAIIVFTPAPGNHFLRIKVGFSGYNVSLKINQLVVMMVIYPLC